MRKRDEPVEVRLRLFPEYAEEDPWELVKVFLWLGAFGLVVALAVVGTALLLYEPP